MAYQVSYSGSYQKKDIQTKEKNVLVKVVGICVIVIGLLLIPAVRSFLIPGDTAVTKSAVSNFKSNIEAGAPLDESFTAFCKEILEGADIP